MRPEMLFPLFRSIGSLKGVGPKIAPLIEKVAGERVRDLAFLLPVGVIDRRYQPKIIEAEPGRLATIRVRVTGHQPSHNRRAPYKVMTADATGELALVFFHSTRPYLEKLLPPGEERLVSGMVEEYRGLLQITHPDHIVSVEDITDLPLVEPVYPLTAGLTTKTLRKAVDQAVEQLPDLPEWLNGPLQARHGWPGWLEALKAVHAPETPEALEPSTSARRRLAYDELLANQLALVLVRAKQKRPAHAAAVARRCRQRQDRRRPAGNAGGG